MKIAFITPEFIIERPTEGGLGNYVNRMALTLIELGHEVHVFTYRYNCNTEKEVNYTGIHVFHITKNKGLFAKLIRLIDFLFLKSSGGRLTNYLSGAYTMAVAVKRANKQHNYSLIQMSNSGLPGLFISNKECPNLIMRLSSVRNLYHRMDGIWHLPGSKLEAWLEKCMIKRTLKVYAPSFFTADYYRKFNVEVIRPPFFIESNIDLHYSSPIDTPFFIHFGSIGRLKGSENLAKALLNVWKVEPNFRMIWVGKERMYGEMDKYRDLWADKKENILWLNELAKPQLYALIKQAYFAVLPSVVDNLPNTVMEALSLGTPVIAYDGASVNELVKDHINGFLAKYADVDDLTRTILYAYQSPKNTLPKGSILSPLKEELDPYTAALKMLSLIKND